MTLPDTSNLLIGPHVRAYMRGMRDDASRSVIASCQGWGPWASGLDVLEVKIRFRVLSAIVRLRGGPAGNECRHALLTALIDPEEALAAASAAFERMPTMLRRRTLSTCLADAQEVRP